MTIHLTSCHYADRPLATASELLELANCMDRGEFVAFRESGKTYWPPRPLRREADIIVDALRRAARA